MANELSGIMSGTGAKMKAEVGDDRVTFRGAFKGDVPFEDIVAEARGTLLVLSFRGHIVELGAGSRANQLASKIRSPPSRLDRMGIEVGVHAAVAGKVDAALRSEIATRAVVAAGVPKSPVAVLFYGIDGAAQLDAVGQLVGLVEPGGVLWILHPDPLAAKVGAVARAAGLVPRSTVGFPTGTTAASFSRRA